MLSKLMTLLRALLRKSEMERELDEELRYHIELQTESHLEPLGARISTEVVCDRRRAWRGDG